MTTLDDTGGVGASTAEAGRHRATPADLVRLARLPSLDHAARLTRCRGALADHGLDALLVTKPEHLRYLVGFTGSAGCLVVRAESALFVTDGRYDEQSRRQLQDAGLQVARGPAVDVEIEVTVDPREVLGRAVGGLHVLGLEAASVTWAQQRLYAHEWFPGIELVPTEGLIEAWRIEKEPAEVARIEAAAAIADAALEACLPLLGRGATEADLVTEADFALELDTTMRRLGASGPAFDTIVAAGPNSSRPHHRPTGRPIREGDLVVIDFGATVDGYRSDMTRTVCVGQASAEQRRLYDVVGEAQAAGVAAVRPGCDAREVDAAARKVVVDAGWGERFPHGTGHGVGLEIHEAPYVGRTSTATLSELSVVTVEPGVYLEGVGGVRTEDTVVVTADGCRALTRFPKFLIL
jgi:Xaa-Pro aminopeptidase